VPFDREMGYRVVDALRDVAARHGARPARVAIAWLLSRPAVSSVIIAARRAEQLDDNIAAVDLDLSDEDIRQLDAASDPGIPYPKWMFFSSTLRRIRAPGSCILSAMRRVVRGKTCAEPDGPAE
jgi:diketogulonate reductase-like aldo/keto reductase